MSSNDNTVYNQNKNDKWIYSININWTGWRFVTIKYSDFKKPTNDSNKGGGKLEAFKLSGLAFELSSQPSAGQEVYCKIDYVTVTEGGPFKQ